MRWLLITDNEDIKSSVNDLLFSTDKTNKLVSSDFNVDNIVKTKKEFKEIAGCIIYSTNDSLDSELTALFSSIAGYLAFDKINLFTNLKFITTSPLIAKDGVIEVSSPEDLLAILKKKYSSVTKTASERLSKNKLLKRGIPFTSDCFATYIAKNKIEIFNEFLEAGMGVNVRDDVGTPMLNIACRNDNFEFVEMLLDLGADLNAVSEDRGYTAVMDAIWRGNEKITQFLISKGADLNTINKEGQTNLILAVGADRINLVKLLAENGADPDVKDMMGMSAYGYATLFRKEKIAEILKPFHKES